MFLQRLSDNFQPLEDMITKKVAASLIAVSLLASGSAFAQSTTLQGADEGVRAGSQIGGPVGGIVGGTVGAAVGAAVEIPNAVITSIPRGDRSVVVQERVVVGEPLPPSVELPALIKERDTLPPGRANSSQ